jgi:hypothetical protein
MREGEKKTVRHFRFLIEWPNDSNRNNTIDLAFQGRNQRRSVVALRAYLVA